eukprot:g38475.t1
MHCLPTSCWSAPWASWPDYGHDVFSTTAFPRDPLAPRPLSLQHEEEGCGEENVKREQSTVQPGQNAFTSLVQRMAGVCVSEDYDKQEGCSEDDTSVEGPRVVAPTTFELCCEQSRNGVTGLITCSLAPNYESLTISVTTAEGKKYQGMMRAEGWQEPQDIKDAFEVFQAGDVKAHVDRLKITGLGFQIKIKEVEREVQEKDKSLDEEVLALRSEVQRLTLLVQKLSTPTVYEVPQEELQRYGWGLEPATSLSPEGKVPDDDVCWRGSFTGQVRITLWCGRVLMEGQLSGVGPGMRQHSEHRLGNTAFSEVTLCLFKLPWEFRPITTKSFSRRLLDVGSLSSDYIGGIANGNIGYRPLRRLDVLPDGFVVLVCCLHVKTELRKVLRRPSRWCVALNRVQYFL